MTPRILFVCLGNICRSPTAEAVMRSLAPDLTLDSAGTGNWHIGDPPYAPMVEAAGTRGYDLAPLRARQITTQDFQDFDLIVTMDDKNFSSVSRMAPADSTAQLRRLMDYAPETGTTHVPDPYYTRDFDEALDLIETACKALKASLD